MTLKLGLTPDLALLEPIGDMLSVLADDTLELPVKANAYVAGRRLKLTLDRALREPGRQLQAELVKLQMATDPKGAERHKPFRAGPLRLSWKAIEPKWVCNDPQYHTDPKVQAALAELDADPATRPFVALIPQHFEILPQAIGMAMSEGDPIARLLFEQSIEKGWRSTLGRAAVVEVTDDH